MSDDHLDKSVTITESVGAGAAGGAAVGAMAGLIGAVGSLAMPIIGSVLGVATGALIGWLARPK